MRRALVLTHIPFEDSGTLGAVLQERDFQIEIKDVCLAEADGFDDTEADLLVVLGAPIGVYETVAYPFLETELDVLRKRLQRRAPTIGICLGSQLMAAALGAVVYPGPQGREIGWSTLEEGPHVAACPAMAEFLSKGVRVLHWHGDTFDLPPGVAHLASTRLYANQAWSIDGYALALQFHPEVTAAGLERWYVGHACELSAAAIDVPTLRREGRTHAPPLERAAHGFWHRWLDSAFAADVHLGKTSANRSIHHA